MHFSNKAYTDLEGLIVDILHEQNYSQLLQVISQKFSSLSKLKSNRLTKRILTQLSKLSNHFDVQDIANIINQLNTYPLNQSNYYRLAKIAHHCGLDDTAVEILKNRCSFLFNYLPNAKSIHVWPRFYDLLKTEYEADISYKLSKSNNIGFFYLHFFKLTGYKIRTKRFFELMKLSNYNLMPYKLFLNAPVVVLRILFLSRQKQFKALVHHYSKSIVQKQIGLVHTLNPCYLAMIPLIAAKRTKVPFIYEVRGFWHMSRASQIKNFETTKRFETLNKLENFILEKSSKVITINDKLKQAIIDRGKDSKGITIIPNMINTQLVQSVDKPHRFSSSLITIGYIGTINEYEGLDYLLLALRELMNTHHNIQLVIGGEGHNLKNLQEQTKALGLDAYVTFLGSVGHKVTSSYYAQFDIVVYPRKGYRVCEIVSPIKPLEAMLFENAVIVSDVAALVEIIEDNETGLVFQKDDYMDLAEKLNRLIENPKLRSKLGSNAKQWVINNRSYKNASLQYQAIYEEFL